MKKIVMAAAGLLLLLGNPAFANQSWEDVSYQTAMRAIDTMGNTPGVRVTTRANGRGLAAPAVTQPPVVVDFIMTGADQTGVPCFGCVNGAQTTSNLGLTLPLAYIPTATSPLQYDLMYNDVSFTGSCKVSLVMTSGATTLFKVSVSIALTSGVSYITATGGTRPTFSGTALFVGKVACPHNTASTTKTTLYFQ